MTDLVMRTESLIPNLVVLRDNHVNIVTDIVPMDDGSFEIVLDGPDGPANLFRDPGDEFVVVGTAPNGDPANIEMLREVTRGR